LHIYELDTPSVVIDVDVLEKNIQTMAVHCKSVGITLRGHTKLKGWDAVIKDFNDKDPFFKKIVDSQKAYAKKVMKYLLMNQPNYRLAYENEFGPIDKVKI